MDFFPFFIRLPVIRLPRLCSPFLFFGPPFFPFDFPVFPVAFHTKPQ